MTDQVFKTTGRAYLTLRPISPYVAESFGCPGATHLLLGHTWHMVGSVAPVTGKAVRVPGWSQRKGVRTVFTPWLVDEPTGTAPVTGWVGL